MAEDQDTTGTGKVAVYGLRDAKRVRRLIDALSAIPCVPTHIFRIDRFGDLLGVVNHEGAGGALTFFVKVERWCDKYPIPLISWTLRPEEFQRNLRAKANKALVNYTCGVGQKKPHMLVEYDLRRHGQIGEKTRRSVS